MRDAVGIRNGICPPMPLVALYDTSPVLLLADTLLPN